MISNSFDVKKVSFLETFLPFSLRFRSKNKQRKQIRKLQKRHYALNKFGRFNKFNKWKRFKKFKRFNRFEKPVVSFKSLLAFRRQKKKKYFKYVSRLGRGMAKKKVPFLGYIYGTMNNTNFFQLQSLPLSASNLTKGMHVGSLSRGYPLLLKRVGLRVFMDHLLKPKWYRLSKLAVFRKYLFARFETKKFTDGFVKNSLLAFNFAQKKNFSFLFQFFFSKRWFLEQVLNSSIKKK